MESNQQDLIAESNPAGGLNATLECTGSVSGSGVRKNNKPNQGHFQLT